MGVVTGIVQDFQFGMNWSTHSRFVGDIFGWDKLPRRIHLATIWITAAGTVLSAYFILAANAFMQNPVGFRLNEARGRAELTDIWAVLTNKVSLASFPHVIAASFMVSSALVVCIAAWHLARRQNLDTMRPAMIFALWTMIGAGILTELTGDQLGLVMVQTQPMKMALVSVAGSATRSVSWPARSPSRVSSRHSSPT